MDAPEFTADRAVHPKARGTNGSASANGLIRVAFLTEWFDPEPGCNHGLTLAKWMVQRGYDVQVLTGIPNYPGGKFYPGYRLRPFQWERMEGIPVLRVPLFPSHDTSASKRVLTYGSFALSAALLGLPLLRKVDVAYVYHPPPTIGLPALALHYLGRVPYLYHIADVWPDTVTDSGMIRNKAMSKAVEFVLHAWCNHLYRRASHITVLSKGVKRLLEDRGVPPEKVHAIYDWTNEEVFHPLPRDEEFARSLGLGDTVNVLYAGNFGPMQALDSVIRAAARVKELANLRVVLAGTGPLEQSLRTLAAELEADNVVFLGRRQFWEMPRVYSIADVLLVHLKDIPFYVTAIPSKTQVSLAVGRPILMAIRGDAADVIEESGAGIACEPENVEQLAAAMRDFYHMEPSRRAEMGHKGYQFYRDHMSLEAGGTRVDALLRSMVKVRR
ncbi:MAG: glycosyltransferase family 4 protein [Candidatus Eremiobacterota bacterium]